MTFLHCQGLVDEEEKARIANLAALEKDGIRRSGVFAGGMLWAGSGEAWDFAEVVSGAARQVRSPAEIRGFS